MSEFRSAIVTISYAPDFERCALLARSVKEFVDPSIKHYIAVDRRDLALFRQLAGPRTDILAVESVMPWWVFRMPLAKRWWLSLKTKPVRNWILQQGVKLSMPRHLQEDVLMFVDSDVAFVRPFDDESFIRGDQVRLFRLPGEGKIVEQYPWHQTAARLLGLPPTDYFGARYIGNIVSWRRDNALKMYEHIERTTGRNWLESVVSQWHLSEYILYGVFVDHVLKEQSGHWADVSNICHEYWDDRPLSREALQEFFATMQPEHVAVMISAKARMGLRDYGDLM
jgi:hypothetical protein